MRLVFELGLGLGLACGLGWAAAAWAENVAPPSDVQCLTGIGYAASQTKDKEQMIGLTVAAFYYLGKMDAGESGANLKARVIAEADKLSAEQAIALSQRCIVVVRGKAEFLQGLNKP